MDETPVTYEQLIERFVAWAQDRPDIHAALVLGSRARNDHPADEWSDLDIVVIVADPTPYLASADWLANCGEVWVTFLEATAAGGGMERRALFAGGLDVDFAILPYAQVEEMTRLGLPPAVVEIFRRGVRVLLDRNGLITRDFTRLPPLTAPITSLTAAAFRETAHDFWYHAVWTAKKLRRGELWTAKTCCDGVMKGLLLKALEAHARAASGGQRDTWHDGRFLEEWADPRAVAALAATFADYDQASVWRALTATMALFRWLTQETAGLLGFPYPATADRRATELVEALSPGV